MGESVTFDELKHNSRWLFTNLKKLIADGISDTTMITREYLFTADNWIDAKADYGCDSTGTKTITPLPDNTVSVYIQFFVSRGGSTPAIQFRRKSTDSTLFRFFSTTDDGTGTGYVSGAFWLPTNENQFYIDGIFSAVSDFYILGYKVAE